MTLSEDEKIIKNYLLFISVRENKTIKEKVTKIEKHLDEGADVNASDANNNNNTALHIAVKRGEKDIIQLLIKRRASVLSKNSSGKTPLDIANELEIDKRQQIVDILLSAGTTSPPESNQPAETAQNFTNQQTGIDTQPKGQIVAKTVKKDEQFLYQKRTGTSGVSGQLYETKLLSLVLLRALIDKDIEEFYLGTNISRIGALDDICLRYKIKDQDKPIMLFLQAKHREDRDSHRLTVTDVQNTTGDFSLAKYLDSYLRIKEYFDPNSKDDDMFSGEFNNVECNFIIYTPVKDSFDKKLTGKNKLSEKVNYLIETNTEGVIFQYNYDIADVDALTSIIIKERIRTLGQTFLHFIFSKKAAYQHMMTDDLMKRYHVVLALQVIEVSELEPKKKLHRDGKFRSSFFTNNEEFLNTLQETFYKGLSTKRYDEKDLKEAEIITQINRFIQNPCGNTLSRLIGNVMAFDDKPNTLKLMDSAMLRKQLKKDVIDKINAELNEKIEKKQKEILPEIVKEAIRIKLESHKFQLPPTFGNLDLQAKGKRIVFLANKLIELLDISQNSKIVEINDDIVGPNKLLQQGFVDINGGIGGAVGNLLILDEDSKMMKFNMRNNLPENANVLLGELIKKLDKNADLSRYRINININGFPKVSFHGDDYDKRQAKDFLSKLWFYTFQGQETNVERILKKEIDTNYNNDKGKNEVLFRIHSDAIYLRSHDEIQKWWMLTSEAPYLTKKNDLFHKAKKDVIDSPLLTVLNLMYINKIKKMDVEYTKNAVRTLQLDNFKGLLVVISDANMLSGIKLMQHFRHFDNYSFIDFDYVLNLPLNDYNTMIWELGETKIKTLIIMYQKPNSEELCTKMKDIVKKFKEKQTTSDVHIQRNIIIVTDKVLADAIRQYLPDEYNAVVDKNKSLNYLSPDSKEKIKKAKIVFQGDEITLETIIDKNSEEFVKPEILYRLINNEKIEIGPALTDSNYDDIKKYYVDRYLTRDETCQVNTLNDIVDDTVLVTAKPGMGLSTLLTHLSVKTKEIDPSLWILRIKLPDYTKEFLRWQDVSAEKIQIDRFETIKFIFKTVLKTNDGQKKIELAENKGDIILIKNDEIKGSVLLALELFIYFYNNRRIIILFDDFQGISPHYDKEAIKLLITLKNDNIRMWIASCSYSNSKILLQREFGAAYTLEPLTMKGSKNFLTKFFDTNLRLEKLNQDQFENVLSFLEFMANKERIREVEREYVPVLSLIFHLIYIVAVNFFQSEINRVTPRIFHEKVRQTFDIDMNQFTLLDDYLGRTPEDEQQGELAGTPLHLYIAANYFKCEIKDRFLLKVDKEEVKKKWEIAVNTFTLYKRFLEAYTSNLFNQGDDKINDEDVIDSYTDKHKEFMSKYKKLGLYAIYKESDLSKLLSEDDICEIKNTMNIIESGEDRAGLISCVINSIPKFGHLVLAQYFAIEGLMDVLKANSLNEVENPWKNEAIWHAILNILLFKSSPRVRQAFDYKLKHDPILAEMSSSEVCQKVVFELLLKGNNEYGSNSETNNDTVLNSAINDGFLNITNLILKSIEINLDADNLDDFIKLIYNSALMFTAFSSEYKGLVDSVLNCIKNVDSAKLQDLIRSGQLTEVPTRHVNLFLNSDTAMNLRSHLMQMYEQFPAFTQTIQDIYNQSDNMSNIVSGIMQCGLKNVFEAFTQPPRGNHSGQS